MDLHIFARGLCRKNANLRSKSGAKIFCMPKNTGCLPQINLELSFCIFAKFLAGTNLCKSIFFVQCSQRNNHKAVYIALYYCCP